MTCYHISGHLDLTQAEFSEHYEPRIDKALQEGASFVVGDAAGADALAQAYLAICLADNVDERVTIFHMFEKPRNDVTAFSKDGGYESDDDRDIAMMMASDEDIAWVRPGREKSGTARNIERRAKFNKLRRRKDK